MNGHLWHEAYTWYTVARILLMVLYLNAIVGQLWHESHWPVSQPTASHLTASQPASQPVEPCQFESDHQIQSADWLF